MYLGGALWGPWDVCIAEHWTLGLCGLAKRGGPTDAIGFRRCGQEYSRWSDILWETLPFRAVVEGAETITSDEKYVQDELTRDLRTSAPPIKAG